MPDSICEGLVGQVGLKGTATAGAHKPKGNMQSQSPFPAAWLARRTSAELTIVVKVQVCKSNIVMASSEVLRQLAVEGGHQQSGGWIARAVPAASPRHRLQDDEQHEERCTSHAEHSPNLQSCGSQDFKFGSFQAYIGPSHPVPRCAG